MVKIESPRESRKLYPDNGSGTETYANGDPNQYVELEMPGPLENLQAGGGIQRVQLTPCLNGTMPMKQPTRVRHYQPLTLAER